MSNSNQVENFYLDNVLVSYVGPLKDEILFEGKLFIVLQRHGHEIEWHPARMKTSDAKESPEADTLKDWEDLTSSVGYKANHNDSIDAVEIKSVPVPNAIKFDVADLKSFKKLEGSDGNRTVVTFLLKDGTNVPSFQFQNSDFGKLCAALDNYVRFRRSKKEPNLYIVIDPKVEALEKSFSELDLFTESRPHLMDIINNPYATALGSFSKVTNFVEHVIYGNSYDAISPPDMHFSELPDHMLNLNIDHSKEPGFAIVTDVKLPPRPSISREDPVTFEEWNSHVNSDGRITDVQKLKSRIFRGGLVHSIRSEAWKYLLGFYNYDSTTKDKLMIRKKREEAYFRMKLQWKTIDADQESRFSALRERKSLIEKDVSRTDRTHPFYEGENNPNIQMLHDILMTYCMYNFDLGYVQGMSDLLSPILVVMQNELDAFWCFAGWLEQIGANFEMEQLGMKNQLLDLHRLLHFVDSHLCSYLEEHESGNLYFAFRWLLILFKRDFKFKDIMTLWEVFWTGLPCKNFHLLMCIAILDREKTTIMENNYGLNEILKHVNEMSYKIDLKETLSRAEAIFIQIKESEYQSDVVQSILGLEPRPLPKTPPAATETARPIVRQPLKPPGYAVPIHKDVSSEQNSSGPSSIDEYVDLEHYRMFDLYS